MADLEDQHAANPAPMNGLSDDSLGFDDSSLGLDASHLSKFTDPHSQHPFDTYTPQPSSVMADKDYDQSGYGYGDDEDENDFGRANALRDHGHFQDEQFGDLPANFAKEAARHQNFPESDNFEDETYVRGQSEGRDDESEEVLQQGSNPFAVDPVKKPTGVSGGNYVDTSDRPIVGYNPFLNEEAAYEKEEEEDAGDEHGDVSQEDNEQYHGGHEGELAGREYGDGREDHAAYDRFEDEDDSYHQREPDEKVQHYEEVGGRTDDAVEGHSEDEKTEEQSEGDVQSPGESPERYIHSQDTRAFQPEVSHAPGQYDNADFETSQYDDSAYKQRAQEADYDEYPEVQNTGINDDKGAVDEDTHRDEGDVPQQSGQAEDDDLGIVNQGFSDDGDLEAGRVIPEEEEPTSSASAIVDTELYEEKREGRPEERAREEEEEEEEIAVHHQEKQYDDDEEEDYSRQHDNEDDYEKGQVNQEEEIEYASRQTEQEPEDEDYDDRKEGYRKGQEDEEMEGEDYTQDGRLQSEAADVYQTSPTKVDYKQINYDDDEEESEKTNEDFVQDGVKTREEQSYHGSPAVDDYTAQYLRADEEDMNHTTSPHGGDGASPQEKPDEDESYGKDFSSRFAGSDLLSTERGFVDNLSDVTSPEAVPQPLPSPPEPKNLSCFDPLAASDSTPPGPEPEVNVGRQHGDLFEHGFVADESNTADFLTAGEVEGETKFGVDGTAITSTSQNNAFLHSDEEDEEEDEEESQHLDQGQAGTTGTTETETSAEERSAEYEAQHGGDHMEGNDNALMSMSMEGSFYDDGGELIGGEDKKNQHENNFYEERSFAEESSLLERLEPKQESYLEKHEEFGQITQEESAVDEDRYQPQDDFDVRGNELDVEPRIIDAVRPASEENGVHEEEDKPGGFDSEVDLLEPERVPHTLAVAPEEVADSFVDHVGVDSTANESESSVDSQHPHVHEVESPKDVEDTVSEIEIVDVSPEKPEEPAASVEETPAAGKEDTCGAALETSAPEAAAATAVGVAVAAAAAAAATATTKTATTVKKSSAKAGAKTTTTTTTTKVTKETKATAAGKVTTTKKAEVTTATSKTTPRKPTESRPTTATTTEKKTPARPITSPTKPSSATPGSAKSSAAVPSHIQPAAARKPKEVKPATPAEEKKKPATTTTTTPRTPSATHRTPRPQSATATSSTSSTTATGTSTTTTTKTTTRTPLSSSATRTTASTARPKSSPTKLTNGIASATLDTKSPAKKHGIDTKPASARTPVEKKEVKTTPKVDAASKSTTPAAATRSPTKTTTTPRTPATPKSAETRSKIGSMENATHTPGGGHVRIASKKPDFSNVTSKVGSKDKIDHKPGGGNIRIETKKVKVEAKSKVGSLNNTTHKPGGGDKKTESQKTSKVQSVDKQGPGSGSEQGAVEVQNGAASEN